MAPRRFLSAIALAASVAVPRVHAQARIPAGTPITFRIAESVSSDTAMAGRAFHATVMGPVRVDARLLITPGTKAFGHVVRAGRDSAKRYMLDLAFDSVVVAGGVVPLSVRVTSVDNARERVDSAGRIVGGAAARTLRSRRTWSMMALGLVHPVAAAALWSASTLGVRERDARIRYPAGTDVATVVTRDLLIRRAATHEEWSAVLRPDSLRHLMAGWPVHASAEKGTVGADPINIALIGDSATIVHAFRAAGWDVAARMGMKADFATFLRASANRGYAHQPVSTLLLDGRAPDLIFERVTNTMAKRHHIRLWRWTDRIDGQSVWLASASHDVGIEYLRDRRHFTHRIDAAIDAERDKVANDLWAADCIAQRSDVARSLPMDLRVNDGRDLVRTDGELVVLRLRAVAREDAPRAVSSTR
jgi:hypothetical protein